MTALNLRMQCRDGQTRACAGLTQLQRGMDREATRKIEDWVRLGPR